MQGWRMIQNEFANAAVKEIERFLGRDWRLSSEERTNSSEL